MTEDGDTSSNVVTRGLGAIRDAFTDESDDAEQTGEDATRDTETGGTPRQRAEQYADTMQQCAAGDLTVRMDADGDDKAMDRVAVEFNSLVDELEKTTGHLKSYAGEVESAGVGVERSADTVREASEDVVDSMQNVSGDVERQREQLEEISEVIDGVAATLEQFASNHPDTELDAQIPRLEAQASKLRDVAETSEAIQTETTIVSAAVEEQAAELSEVSGRAADLQRYAKPLQAMLDRFETDSEDGARMSEAGPTAGE